jgi:ribonuclease III
MAVDRALEPHVLRDQVSIVALAARKKPDLSVLEARLGHVFSNRALLELALTHMSAPLTILGHAATYQRLEFLGDRVLGLAVAAMLYRTYPDEEEGNLSRRLADLVRKETCAEVAAVWEIGPFLKIGDGEAQSGARRNTAILADVCESIIGAVFLDAGMDAANALVMRAFGERLRAPSKPLRDAKTALQEWAQGQGFPTPNYIEISRSGPDHAPVFQIAAHVEGLVDAVAQGRSKRLGEQAAAEAFLRREGLWNDGGLHDPSRGEVAAPMEKTA